MHLHVLGICGTFMGGLARLAKQAGHRVTGCDAAVYPPMSDQLVDAGIELIEGYEAGQLSLGADCYVVGNVVTRGNPLMEVILDRGLPFISGPQWLYEHVLRGRRVLAVAGTHGKTTTTAMLAHILEQAGLAPGFLVGGVPVDFGISARLGRGPCFVIEADEYDTAFFDKRSKFVHYFPQIAVLNNLEFDHADIFPDLAAIQTQFHHLVRCVPGAGRLVVNGADAALANVLERGCWTGRDLFDVASGWHGVDLDGDAGRFEVRCGDRVHGSLMLAQPGLHNRSNALAAIAAAAAVGVEPSRAIEALAGFGGVRRRCEVRGTVRSVTVYDDFAHHPTAILATLRALRRGAPGRLLAVFEPRSNTMRLGSMRQPLVDSLKAADAVFCYAPNQGRHALAWDAREALASLGGVVVGDDLQELARAVAREARSADRVVVMSNGGFGGMPGRILDELAAGPAQATGEAGPGAAGASGDAR